jgi:hypothetical protein
MSNTRRLNSLFEQEFKDEMAATSATKYYEIGMTKVETRSIP